MNLPSSIRSKTVVLTFTLFGAYMPVLTSAESLTERLEGDPTHGKAVYQVCMSCHSLDEDDVGPRHRGVVGRVAGTVPGYAYSPALRSSGLTWDARNLDRWLANPQALVPGTKMFFALPNAQDRADVIAYLANP
jgi:cytochrome c